MAGVRASVPARYGQHMAACHTGSAPDWTVAFNAYPRPDTHSTIHRTRVTVSPPWSYVILALALGGMGIVYSRCVCVCVCVCVCWERTRGKGQRVCL